MEKIVQTACLLLLAVAAAAIVLIVLQYPARPAEIREFLGYALVDGGTIIPVVAVMIVAGIGCVVLRYPQSWVQRLALACMCIVVGYVGFRILYVERAFGDMFPNEGLDLGFAPGVARTRFLTHLYWEAGIYLAVGIASSSILMLLSRLRRPPAAP